MGKTIDSIDVRGAETRVKEGRVTLAAKSNDVALHARAPRVQPLGSSETILTLQVSGPGFETEVKLSSAEMDALADAIHGVQSGEVFEDV